MNIKTAKEAIWNFEYYTNGYGRLSGMDVKVVNLRLTKKSAIADVKLIDREDNHVDRYNGQRYSIVVLEKWTNKFLAERLADRRKAFTIK
ncbi:hypothetical protein ES703_08231 [subsurface metagenome]